MMKPRVVTVLFLLVVGLTFACNNTKETAQESTIVTQDQPTTVQKITKEEVKNMLDDPGVAVIDVRKAGGWMSSDSKIKGAVREDPSLFDSWADAYSKDLTIVLYCS